MCRGAWKHGPESPVGVISLCMGFTLVDSWNSPYKPLSCHTLVLHGVYSGWSMKLHMKSHCFFTHWHCMGFTLVDSWNCPCNVKTVLPHFGITWFHTVGPWSCPCKPLFCYSLVLHGAHNPPDWDKDSWQQTLFIWDTRDWRHCIYSDLRYYISYSCYFIPCLIDAFCFSLNVLHADGVSWTRILGSVEVIVLLKMLKYKVFSALMEHTVMLVWSPGGVGGIVMRAVCSTQANRFALHVCCFY